MHNVFTPAHSAMNNYYRYDDIDAGIIKHSTWLIDAVKAGDPAMRAKYAPRIVAAYVNIAEAWAGQGRNDDAIGEHAHALGVGRDRDRMVGTGQSHDSRPSVCCDR